MTQSADEINSILDTAVSKAFGDDAYMLHLLRMPNEALSEVGLEIPDGVNITIVVNTENTVYLVLPAAEPGTMTTLSWPPPGTFTKPV